jgi:hypothetical protein
VELGNCQVELEIGTIVVEGLGRVDERALAAGAESELARMLATRGLPDGLPGTARTLRASPFEAPSGRSGAALGAAVGRAIYGALGR